MLSEIVAVVPAGRVCVLVLFQRFYNKNIYRHRFINDDAFTQIRIAYKELFSIQSIYFLLFDTSCAFYLAECIKNQTTIPGPSFVSFINFWNVFLHNRFQNSWIRIVNDEPAQTIAPRRVSSGIYWLNRSVRTVLSILKISLYKYCMSITLMAFACRSQIE